MNTNTITENEGLIYSIINKYSIYFDKDDLYQAAMVGLLDAYRNYSKDMDTKFSSYAYFYIVGEVQKYIRENKGIKVNRQTNKLYHSVIKTKEILTQKLLREPTSFEVACFLECDQKIVDDAINSNFIMNSLDNDCSLYNMYGYEEKSYQADLLDLKNELDKLEEPYKTIISNRYLQEKTQSEVASILGITQVQVYRKEQEGLQRLRKRL